MEQKLKTDFDKFISTSNFSNQEIKLKKEALDIFLKNGLKMLHLVYISPFVENILQLLIPFLKNFRI